MKQSGIFMGAMAAGIAMGASTTAEKRPNVVLMNPPLVNKREVVLIELSDPQQNPVRLYLKAPKDSLKLLDVTE